MSEGGTTALGVLALCLMVASLGVAIAGNPTATAIVICGWLYFLVQALNQEAKDRE